MDLCRQNKRKKQVQNTSIQYPALVYKNNKSNVFVANCIIKNLIGYGHSEEAAISNLEEVLNRLHNDYPVRIKPVYKFLSELK